MKNSTLFPSGAEQTRGRSLDRRTQEISTHRVVLRSIDRDVGTSRIDARFSGVCVPEAIPLPATLFVESFHLQNDDAGALGNRVMELRLRGLTHPRGWESGKGSGSDLLACFTGYDYTGSSDLVGVPVSDPHMLQHKTLNIYVTPADGDEFLDFVGDWTLVLGCVPAAIPAATTV